MHWDLFGRGRQENPLEGLRDLLLSVTVDEGDHSNGGAQHSDAAAGGASGNGGGTGGSGTAGVLGRAADRSVLSSSSSGSFSEDRP